MPDKHKTRPNVLFHAIFVFKEKPLSGTNSGHKRYAQVKIHTQH